MPRAGRIIELAIVEVRRAVVRLARRRLTSRNDLFEVDMRTPAWLILPLLSGCMMAPMAVMHAPSAASQPDGGGAMQTTAACPMAVPGTQVAAVDTPDGVALLFTTAAGDVEELQRRVAGVAERHNQQRTGMGEHGGMTGHAGMMMMMGHGGMADHGGMAGREHAGSTAPPSVAAVQPGGGGARILLTPLDAANLPALRSHVHEQAAWMQSSRACTTDQTAPSGAPTSPAQVEHG